MKYNNWCKAKVNTADPEQALENNLTEALIPVFVDPESEIDRKHVIAMLRSRAHHRPSSEGKPPVTVDSNLARAAARLFKCAHVSSVMQPAWVNQLPPTRCTPVVRTTTN